MSTCRPLCINRSVYDPQQLEKNTSSAIEGPTRQTAKQFKRKTKPFQDFSNCNCAMINFTVSSMNTNSDE